MSDGPTPRLPLPRPLRSVPLPSPRVWCEWRAALVFAILAGVPWLLPSDDLVAWVALFCLGCALGVMRLSRQREEIDRLNQEVARLADSHKQALLDAATEVAIIATDVHGMITVFNHGAERMLGYAAADMIGQKLLSDVHLEIELSLRARELMLQFGGQTSPIDTLLEVPRRMGMEHRDWTYVCQSGKRIFVHVVITTVRDPQGEVVGFLGVANDVTEQKWAEVERQRYVSELEAVRMRLEDQAREMAAQAERLKEAQLKAEAANRSKSEFLANMSHEIRTPMTAILGFADLLELEDGIDMASPTRKDALQTIRRNGEHLVEIINDILDVSKIEAGKLSIETVRFCPSQAAHDVVQLMRTRAAEKQLPLRLEINGPLPDLIESDPTRFRQILINLVGNAVKFTDSGEVCVRVSFESETLGGSRLKVEVQDTGVGMTAEQMSRLFRPFTQADSSMSRKFGGTGLGLTISLRLAEMLGGTITVTSRPGAGSTFTVTIGTGITGRMTIDRKSAVPASTAVTTTLPEGCHVLLAEDGVDNQRLITHVLRKAGAHVTVAENGRLAVETAWERVQSRQPFDVILMDMQMPELDGNTATRQLREKGYRMPIIALTAHAMEEDRQRCLNSGCDDYATKPIDRPALLALIARYVSLAPTRWQETLLETVPPVRPPLPTLRHETTLAVALSR